MRSLRALSVCIALALTLVFPACATSPTEDVSKTAEISGAPLFTKTMDFAEGPDAGDTPDIVWHPCYMITNHGTQVFNILNITVDIPYGIDQKGRKLDLAQAKPVDSIAIFRTEDELKNDRASTVQNPPVEVEPGESVYIMPREALMITVDGTRLPLPRSANLLDWLGPLLRLQLLSGGGYHCTSKTDVNATMTTDRGSITQLVQQAFMPVGCQFYVPGP